MSNMKKSFCLMGMAAALLWGCNLNETKLNPDVPMVDREQPVITYEGSGNLVTGEIGSETTLKSTYSWEAKDNAIVINIGFDLEEYIESGEWGLGYFFLDLNSINDYLGILVTADTDEDNFYGVEPDGTPCDWTSYKPGMWFKADGYSSNYSTGVNYWQWYIWTGRDDIYYDYGEGTDKAYNGLFLVGGNPGNVSGAVETLAGSTVTSRAKLVAGGETYDFIVNIQYSEYVAEKKAEGSGNLQYHNWISDDGFEVVETTSKYSWVIHETEGVAIDVEINTEEWQETGDWEIGFFDDMTPGVFESVFGFDPSTLGDDAFYAVDASGAKIDWTSYAPGMWINSAGEADNWSSGNAYWQWYIRAQQYYDYGYEGNEGLFMIGGNPGNIMNIEFDTPFTSKAVIEKDGVKIPLSVTYTFHDVILPETEGYPEAVFEETGTLYPYGGGVERDHTIQWYFDETGLFVDVEASIPQILSDDVWVFTAATIPTEVMTAYLGIDDINKLADLTYFYPLNADGTPSGEWTTYTPGEWVDADGNATSWSTGHMYWWYNFGDYKYEGHFTEGLFLVGTNPGNVVAGETVVSKAQLGDKLLTVTVHFFEEYPTAKTGQVGPFTYSWTLGEGGVDIQSNVSLAAMDDSWAWMGFFLNEAYVNAKYGVDIADLATSLDTFYPVDAESWTSYAPGMWFKEDGSAGAWDTGVSFWQYYTSNYNDIGYHDFTAPNLLYVGKNPGYSFTPGSYTSKAKFGGYDFNFTINIAE